MYGFVNDFPKVVSPPLRAAISELSNARADKYVKEVVYIGFSADCHNGQTNTTLPGSNVISAEPKDADGIFIANVQKMRADTLSTIPPSHMDPESGFIKSDIPQERHVPS